MGLPMGLANFNYRFLTLIKSSAMLYTPPWVLGVSISLSSLMSAYYVSEDTSMS